MWQPTSHLDGRGSSRLSLQSVQNSPTITPEGRGRKQPEIDTPCLFSLFALEGQSRGPDDGEACLIESAQRWQVLSPSTPTFWPGTQATHLTSVSE